MLAFETRQSWRSPEEAMLLVLGRLRRFCEPLSLGMESSSQSVLLCRDEIEQSESLLFWCLVESCEGFADNIEKLFTLA